MPPDQEEMAELKAQLYLLEKEKKALELKLSSREAQEQAYLVHIEHLKSEVEEQKEQRMRSLSSASSSSKDKASKVRCYLRIGGGCQVPLSPPLEPVFILCSFNCILHIFFASATKFGLGGGSFKMACTATNSSRGRIGDLKSGVVRCPARSPEWVVWKV